MNRVKRMRGHLTLRQKIGKTLCIWGFHKWGEPYPNATDFWGFPCGHHSADCQREGCTWKRHYWPS